MEKLEVIAIIPARGGSKGIPRKNIVELCGKPLIAYSILAAQGAGLVDRVIVSTEDEEIANTAKAWGAEVPFFRPEGMAGDQSNVKEALRYTISKLGGHLKSRIYLELYPTSPFRTSALLDDVISIIARGYKRVITVRKTRIEPQYLYNKVGDEFQTVFGKEDTVLKKKVYYRPYPLCFAHMVFNEGCDFFYEIENKIMSVDIDTFEDLDWAKRIIESGKFKFDFG